MVQVEASVASPEKYDQIESPRKTGLYWENKMMCKSPPKNDGKHKMKRKFGKGNSVVDANHSYRKLLICPSFRKIENKCSWMLLTNDQHSPDKSAISESSRYVNFLPFGCFFSEKAQILKLEDGGIVIDNHPTWFFRPVMFMAIARFERWVHLQKCHHPTLPSPLSTSEAKKTPRKMNGWNLSVYRPRGNPEKHLNQGPSFSASICYPPEV